MGEPEHDDPSTIVDGGGRRNAGDAALAARLTALRHERGWSLAEAATRSGVSRAMVHKIERGVSSPTAALLGRLAAAYGVTIAGLFTPGGDESRIARAADRTPWRDPETGLVRTAVSPAGARPAVTEVTLPAGRSVAYPATIFTGTRQLVWVIAGRLTFEEGETRHLLTEGDCLALGPPAPCSFSNETDAPCTYVVVVDGG